MAGSSTSLVQLTYAPEAVFGQIDTAADARELSITGETLDFAVTKESSQEINNHRGSTSATAVDAEASGGISGEMRYGMYDELLAATLQNPWTVFGTNGVGAASDITATATTLTAAAPTAGASAFSTLKPGQWFTVPGTSALAGTLFRVSKTVAPTNTVITLDDSTPAVPGTYAGVAVHSARLRNGKTLKSFTLQRGVTDAEEFFAYRGMTPNTFSLNMASGSLSTVEFGFMGKDVVAASADQLSPTKRTPPDTEIMSGVQASVCAIWVDGKPLEDTHVMSVALSYGNGLRSQKALCNMGAIGIGNGSIELTVDLEIYFSKGRVFFDEMLANKNMEIAFTSYDNAGNGYTFTLPKANIGTYTSNASAKDQDLMAQINLTALVDISPTDPALKGAALIIDRTGIALPA